MVKSQQKAHLSDPCSHCMSCVLCDAWILRCAMWHKLLQVCTCVHLPAMSVAGYFCYHCAWLLRSWTCIHNVVLFRQICTCLCHFSKCKLSFIVSPDCGSLHSMASCVQFSLQSCRACIYAATVQLPWLKWTAISTFSLKWMFVWWLTSYVFRHAPECLKRLKELQHFQREVVQIQLSTISDGL